MQELIDVDAGDRQVSTLVVRPVGNGPFPMVVLFSHGTGLSPEIQLSGQRLAAGGFAVAMIDRYNRTARLRSYDPGELLAEPKEAKQYMSLLQVVTDADVRSDLDSVVRQLSCEPWAKPSPWGVIGFGIGARSMIRTMAALPELFVAGVGLTPSFCVTDEPDSPHLSVPSLQGCLFFGLGGADSLVSAEDNAILASALAPLGERASHETFPRADHGFAVPGVNYDRSAADRCFQTTLKLFTRTLAW
jgi:carboxymethylenebutenolidase